MKISKISLYQVDLPLKEGAYSWSTFSFASFDSTIVIVETDSGLAGVGEICPLGPSYLPAYAEGARTGLLKIAEGLIGEDPCQIGRINVRMDELLKGHPYVKSALDVACWDILGKATGQPVCNLLGGRLQDRVKLFKVVTRQDPDAMARKIREYQDQGFKQFQMKVGAGADSDIERILQVSAELRSGNVLAADANTGWRQHEALRVVKAIRDVDIYIEQPCPSYEECLAVRQHTGHPMILDECMEDIRTLVRGCQDHAMDVVNLKVGRVGGLTKARQFRDLAVTFGISLTIEDSWGGEIATAALCHLAHSTPAGFHFQSSAFHEYHSLAIASGGPELKDGHMSVSDQPGLGVSPKMDVLGDPVAVVSRSNGSGPR
ncbi:Muconate cycloisomerase [Castellaniella defragrans 65Phen]|uniref:Muconate cycloisomerase n=1 Tax=Castellaniella defragrans (strain DSM 12143 / CCUG 39792 / 65Phen) TaxID=1437824 RepID=W8X457_CASD6|nr:cis-3-hydroxy-L-proline dehydratase [Castellaniella defragrans]CDM24627.1 Muconate cycloisomerase [Castellaniella defragrans 65Phen]